MKLKVRTHRSIKLAATSLAASPSTACREREREREERERRERERRERESYMRVHKDVYVKTYHLYIMPAHARSHASIEVVDIGFCESI